MSETANQFRIADLSVVYPRTHGLAPSLCGVTLELSAVESLCLVGASGSGKSTMLRSVIGLLPPGSRVTGHVHLPNVGALTSLEPDQLRDYRRRSLGVIWQDPVGSLIPGVAVGKQIRRAFSIRHAHANGRRRKSADRKAVESLLRRVGFDDPAVVWAKTPAMLSGGMCQRCVIAQSLAAPALHLLIGDEPTGSLDAVSAAQILDLLFEVQRERGAMFLMVTHDIRLARRFDWIAVMNNGRIDEMRRTVEFFAEPHSDAGRSLLRASQALGGVSRTTNPNKRVAQC